MKKILSVLFIVALIVAGTASTGSEVYAKKDPGTGTRP